MYNRGYHVFLSKVLGITVPELFVGIPSTFQKVWGNRKDLCIIECMTNFRQNFSVSQCRKILWASFQSFGNFRYRKISCIIGGFTFLWKILCLTVRKIFVNESSVFERNSRFETFFRMKKGGITFFRQKILVSQSRKHSWASLQCFRKIVVSGKFMHIRWMTFFCRKFQVWQCQKKHRHPFNFSEIWGNRKTLCIKRVSQFPAENCSSHSAENFCEGILLFLRKILVSKSFYGWRGGGRMTFLRWKKSSHSAEKIVSIPAIIQKNCLIGKNMQKVSITFFCRKFQVWQCRKNSWASFKVS